MTSLLLIAGGLPAVFGGSWYPNWNQCPSSAPTKPVTGDRQCDVSKAKCSSSSVSAVHLESVSIIVTYSHDGAFIEPLELEGGVPDEEKRDGKMMAGEGRLFSART